MKKFNLINYILPSVVSMVIVGTYTNIDGLFIGNRAGDDGLAAINIAWPIVAFITSLGTGLGIGSSVMVNVLRGGNKYGIAEKAKFIAMRLFIIGGLISTVICLLSYSPLLWLLGAKGKVRTYAENYSLIISLGAIFQVVGSGAVVLLRNEGKTYSALAYTAVGLIVHIGLDILTVKKFELYGVAMATVVSQAVVAAMSVYTVLRSRNNGFPKEKAEQNYCDGTTKITLKILKHSIAPFGLNFVPSATLLFTNYFAMKIGGTAAVGAYAVMSYAVYTYDYIFQGVCDGVQPLLSYYRGANDSCEELKTVRKTAIILMTLSVLFVALTPVVIILLPKIFAVSAEAESLMKAGLVTYAFAYPLKAAVKFISSHAYSTGKVAVSNVVTYLDPFLFTPLSLALLSSKGIEGIWIALPVSQALTILVAIVIYLALKNRPKSA